MIVLGVSAPLQSSSIPLPGTSVAPGWTAGFASSQSIGAVMPSWSSSGSTTVSQSDATVSSASTIALSVPGPQATLSATPSLDVIVSSPEPPSSVSAPPRPLIVSLPPAPSSVLASALPDQVVRAVAAHDLLDVGVDVLARGRRSGRRWRLSSSVTTDAAALHLRGVEARAAVHVVDRSPSGASLSSPGPPSSVSIAVAALQLVVARLAVRGQLRRRRRWCALCRCRLPRRPASCRSAVSTSDEVILALRA